MKNLSFLFLLSLAAFALACQTPTTTVNSTNTNATANANTNVNANANTNVADSNMNATGSGVAIETKEPDQYQATVNLKFETLGDQKINAPALQANVARLNDNRRMEFSLPNGEKIIYLDLGGRQFVVSPARKQYAELNKEALGFEVRRLLMPGEIVNQAKTVQGVERVGEEQMNGRTVVKYRYGATTDTKTQAGQVNTESFFYVDKETGLPLRSETVSQSQTGNVQGVSGVRVVTEMSNLQTTADAALFAEPTDYQKVQPEQVRQQVDLLFNAAAAIIGQMMKSAATQPTVSPTP
jgi:hypothetical protein